MNSWRDKIEEVVREMEVGKRTSTLSLPAFNKLVNAPSYLDISAKLAEMAIEGRIKIKYRVLSPENKVQVAEYRRLFDIPTKVFDDTTDQDFMVIPSRDVEVVYEVDKR